MLIIPAIDIKDEHCVRLIQGDISKKKIYSDDPVAQARIFENLGAQMLHVVDLDGAFEGWPVNYATIIALSENVAIPIEVGGGIRTPEIFEMYADRGINRIIVGTAVLEDVFTEIVDKYLDKIVVSIDVRDGKVATHGWKNISDITTTDCIKKLQDKGIFDIIYKDIAAEGMLSGPNFKDIENIFNEVENVEMIASGGISSIDDLKKLKEYEKSGLHGVVIGKALYEGQIKLDEAIKVCK